MSLGCGAFDQIQPGVFDLLGLDAGAKRNLEARAAPSEVFFVHLFFGGVLLRRSFTQTREMILKMHYFEHIFHYLNYLHSLVAEVTHY